MSTLWLKKPTENVSQSDLRRAQEEKAERQTRPENPTPSDFRTPSEKQPPIESEPLRESTPVSIRTPPEERNEPLRNEPVRISGGVVLGSDAPHLRIPYEVWNGALRGRKAQQRVILEELFRASAGWHSDECVISIGKLAQHTGMEATQVREHLKRLYSEGIVERLGDVVGGGDKNARGVRFRVNLPRMPPPEIRTPSGNRPPRKSEPNKEKALKEINKKGINRLTPEEIQSFTSTVADLLGEGQSIEEVEARFAPNMHAVDWATIRSTALAQVPKKGK
jgi:DNA-binding transcriptional ArsR family regulator